MSKEIFEQLENHMRLQLQEADIMVVTSRNYAGAITILKALKDHHNAQHAVAYRGSRGSTDTPDISKIKDRISTLFQKIKTNLSSYLSSRQTELEGLVTSQQAIVNIERSTVDKLVAEATQSEEKASTAVMAHQTLLNIKDRLGKLTQYIDDKNVRASKKDARAEKATLQQENPFLEESLRSALNKATQTQNVAKQAREKVDAATSRLNIPTETLNQTTRLLETVRQEATIAARALESTPRAMAAKALADAAAKKQAEAEAEAEVEAAKNQDAAEAAKNRATAAAEATNNQAAPPVTTSLFDKLPPPRTMPTLNESALTAFDGFVRELMSELDNLPEEVQPQNESAQSSTSARKAATTLLKELDIHRGTFIKREMDIKGFQDACLLSIRTAKDSDLSKQPTFTKLLYDLAFWVSNILTLGLASVVSYAATGNVRFFAVPETEAVKRMNVVQDSVIAITQSQPL